MNTADMAMGAQVNAQNFQEGNSSNKEGWKFEGVDLSFLKEDETAQCRICQADDFVSNMDAPCNCSGTIKMAHKACVLRWCNVKHSTRCEICLKPYRPEYTINRETLLEIRQVQDDYNAYFHERLRRLGIDATRRNVEERENDVQEEEELEVPQECASATDIIKTCVHVYIMRDALASVKLEERSFLNATLQYKVIFLAGFGPLYYGIILVELIVRRCRRRAAAGRVRPYH